MTENFKKLTNEEITERIRRIGGEKWVTPEDYKRFSRQSVLILEGLARQSFVQNRFIPASRKALEAISGSKRVASRIDELRDEWEIETTKMRDGTAAYRLIGRRWEARTKKPHCSTCNCFPKPVPQEQGRMEL
jgi:hypothetical protein